MRPIYLSIILFTLINIASTHLGDGTDYCCLRCGKKHVMCRYKKHGPGKHCRGLRSPRLTEADRNQTLHYLNLVKNKAAMGGFDDVKASGTNFRKLEWDEELESMAVRWAQQCAPPGVRDKCRDSMRFEVDQFIASKGPGVEYKELLHTAFRHQKCVFDLEFEYQIRNYCLPNLVFPGKNVKTFARLIRYDGYKVGCAFQQTSAQSQLICNIGPGVLQQMVELGTWHRLKTRLCSDCPHNTKCSPPYEALCGYTDSEDTEVHLHGGGSTLTSFITDNVIKYLWLILMSFYTF